MTFRLLVLSPSYRWEPQKGLHPPHKLQSHPSTPDYPMKRPGIIVKPCSGEGLLEGEVAAALESSHESVTFIDEPSMTKRAIRSVLNGENRHERDIQILETE
jgi:hypothetical protein